MEIETRRLILREYIKPDWEDVHQYAKQGDILLYEAWGPNNEDDTKQYIQQALDEQKKNPRRVYELAVTLKNTKELIGGCRLEHIMEEHKGNIGYIIHPAYWNQGFASEATSALLMFAKNTLKLKLVDATCDVLNVASQKVLEKCGFIRVNLIANHLIIKERCRDTYVYERTNL